MLQVRVYVSGQVQGVGFRKYIKYHAVKLGLKGWTQNLGDGRVEILVSGQAKLVKRLVSICRRGTMLSNVTDVEIIEDLGYEVDEGFFIKKK